MSFGEPREGSQTPPHGTSADAASSVDRPGLRLEVIAGNAAGTVILVEDELVIGRHAEGAGRLSEDSEISRQHARISREASGDYAIEDLGSSNGTFVNGLKIPSPRLLRAQDSIEVGGTTLVVRSLPSQAPPPPPSEAPPAPGYAPTVFARAPVAPASAPQSAAQPPQAPFPPLLAEDKQAPEPASADDTPAPQPVSVPPPALTLKLEVNFEAREARIALGEDGETIRLVHEHGRWRTPPAGT